MNKIVNDVKNDANEIHTPSDLFSLILDRAAMALFGSTYIMSFCCR